MKRMRQKTNSLLTKIELEYIKESEAIQSIAQKRIKRTGAG